MLAMMAKIFHSLGLDNFSLLNHTVVFETRLMSAILGDIENFQPFKVTKDANMKPEDRIRNMGLEFESFDVVTEDGYILDLWHVYKPNK